MAQPCDVLIVGAGPTGLALALWLTKLGSRPRIIDKGDGVAATSRALAVQARTLELYRQLGLSEAVLDRAHRVPAINLWVKGEPKAHLKFEVAGTDLTPYSFVAVFPQDQHERLLVQRLQELGVSVERHTELLGYQEAGDRIVARLRGPGGAEERCETTYLAGCDGARSTVRATMGTEFPGGTYRQVFYVADVEGHGPAFNGELHIDLDEADFLAVFPLAAVGRARLIGTVADERADHAESLKFEDVSSRAIEHLKVSVDKVNWFSTYRVHHRVTAAFRKGRAFVLGDAAHIHSPAGGQGMNTGIGDAVNLAWKLHAVLTGHAPDELLDSYESERMRFARRLVATTDRVFSFATAEGRVADIVRTRIAPVVMPKLIELEPAREFLFRTVAQLTLNYRDSALSEGSAGHVHGGDRLPWAPSNAGADNFESLTHPTWQVHVYGAAGPELSNWCADRKLALLRFEWGPEHDKAGFSRDAAYLIRPDTYIALADPGGSAQTLERYLAKRRLRV